MTIPRVARVHGAGGLGNGALVFDGRFRVAFVLFGGMLALQSSPTLDAVKITYLVGTVLCLVGALVTVWRARRTPEVRLGVPWIAVSAALAVLIAMSFLVARANLTSTMDWTRDVAAYGLFAAVPVLALDVQSSASRKLLIGLLVVAGILGGVSWAFEWLSRRNIADLPLTHLVFPSGQLPSMLYLFAMATALTARRGGGAWVALGGVILGLFLLTGTRSSLLLLIGPLAIAVLLGRPGMRSSLLTFLSHGVVAVAVVLAFQLALALPTVLEPGGTPGEPSGSKPPATAGPGVLPDRLGSLGALLNSQAIDPSMKERVAQYQAAWALFVSSPIVGVGPGHPIVWTNVSGRQRTGFTADTPLVMPAKFGVVGMLVFLGAAVAYGSTVRTAWQRDPRSVITLTLVGYAVLTIVGLPLGFPVEDKGASLALILLLALAFAERRQPKLPAATQTLSVGVAERQRTS